MASKGDLLDLLEAREHVNRELKRQDEIVARLREELAAAEVVHTEIFGTWRIVNNELALASKSVYAGDGVQVQVTEGPVAVDFDAMRQSLVEAEREDFDYEIEGG